MITEILFLISYLIILPIAFMFPFGGALAYEWLQYMPPDSVYNAGAFSNLSLVMGAIALSLWAARDKKLACPNRQRLFATVRHLRAVASIHPGRDDRPRTMPATISGTVPIKRWALRSSSA